MIKTMNSKITTNSQLSTTQPKKEKLKLSNLLEQEQNHRNGDHMEGYQCRGEGGEWEKKVQGVSSITGRQKMDRGRLRKALEMEKSKNLYVWTCKFIWT